MDYRRLPTERQRGNERQARMSVRSARLTAGRVGSPDLTLEGAPSARGERPRCTFLSAGPITPGTSAGSPTLPALSGIPALSDSPGRQHPPLLLLPAGRPDSVGQSKVCESCGLLSTPTRRITEALDRPRRRPRSPDRRDKPRDPPNWASRLILEDRIKARKLTLGERATLLREPFEMASEVLARRSVEGKLDLPSNLGCLGSFLLPVACLAILPMVWKTSGDSIEDRRRRRGSRPGLHLPGHRHRRPTPRPTGRRPRSRRRSAPRPSAEEIDSDPRIPPTGQVPARRSRSSARPDQCAARTVGLSQSASYCSGPG